MACKSETKPPTRVNWALICDPYCRNKILKVDEDIFEIFWAGVPPSCEYVGKSTSAFHAQQI